MIYGEFYCDSSKFYSGAQRINFQLYISINILCINCYIFFLYISFSISAQTHTHAQYFFLMSKTKQIGHKQSPGSGGELEFLILILTRSGA